MTYLEILLLAIGLSLDTFAVSVSTGFVEQKGIRFFRATKIAVVMAFFQGVFPFVGWLVGSNIVQLFQDYDHWIAFALLFLLGIYMIYGSLTEGSDDKYRKIDRVSVISMAIATSIDSLIVGLSFGMVHVNIWIACAMIAFFTYLFAMIGMLIGKKTGNLIGHKFEIAAGFVIMLIGVKILLEHL
ncbi:manganese efflux pump MntP family protein [Candidatus Kapaibacterium sp.]